MEALIDAAFLDALAGLDSVCRYLAIVLGGAGSPGVPDRGRASHAATVDALGAAGVPGDAAREASDAASDAAREAGHADGDPLDALLGLVSLHRTVSLLLAAVASEAVEQVEPAPAAAWSREVLR